MQKEEREEKLNVQLQVYSKNDFFFFLTKQRHAIKNELKFNIMPDLWHSCSAFEFTDQIGAIEGTKPSHVVLL